MADIIPCFHTHVHALSPTYNIFCTGAARHSRRSLINLAGSKPEAITSPSIILYPLPSRGLPACMQGFWALQGSSLGVWDRPVMTKLVSDRPRYWSRSCSFGLGLILLVLLPTMLCPTCKELCDLITLKCNKLLYFSCNKCRNSKRNWSSYQFLTFFVQS